MAGVRSKPQANGKFQGWYADYTGRRVFFIGTRKEAETRRVAERLEDEHRQVRLGYRPVPKSAAKHARPANPLLYVQVSPSRTIKTDLKAAGVPIFNPGEGKLDFHACRVAYVTFVMEAGASVKEGQTLARHSTPDLTMNVYARTREGRLQEVTEKVAATVLSGRKRAQAGSGG